MGFSDHHLGSMVVVFAVEDLKGAINATCVEFISIFGVAYALNSCVIASLIFGSDQIF